MKLDSNTSRHRSSTLKVLSIFLTVAFVGQEAALAAPAINPMLLPAAAPRPEVRFTLPESVAMIEDGYAAPNATRTIILMQDAHTNESGQMNEAKALAAILPAEQIKHVFTEGADRDASLSFLKKFFPKDVLQDTSVSFVRKGVMKGSEFASVNGDHDFALLGVEDGKLYDQALVSFVNILKRRDKAVQYLDRIERTAAVLKQSVYNDRLKALDAKESQYRSGELSLTDYFAALHAQASELGVYMPQYPHLSFLNELKKSESGIDFAKASREQDAAMKTLGPDDQKMLIAASKEKHSPFRMSGESTTTEKAFYALLEEKLAGQAAAYPALFRYFAYLRQTQKLDAPSVLNELKALEMDVFGRLAPSQDEQFLVVLLKNLVSLKNLLEIKLSPEEFAAFKRESAAFNIRVISGFFNKKIMDLGKHHDQVMLLEKDYDQAVATAAEFYELTYQRDEAFVRNMLGRMDADQASKAVLITGGYHTPNLKRMLKEKGISYVSILPQVLHETDMARYQKIVTSQLADAQKETRLAQARSKANAFMPKDMFDTQALDEFIAVAASRLPKDEQQSVAAAAFAAARLADTTSSIPDTYVQPIASEGGQVAEQIVSEMPAQSNAARLAAVHDVKGTVKELAEAIEMAKVRLEEIQADKESGTNDYKLRATAIRVLEASSLTDAATGNGADNIITLGWENIYFRTYSIMYPDRTPSYNFDTPDQAAKKVADFTFLQVLGQLEFESVSAPGARLAERSISRRNFLTIGAATAMALMWPDIAAADLPETLEPADLTSLYGYGDTEGFASNYSAGVKDLTVYKDQHITFDIEFNPGFKKFMIRFEKQQLDRKPWFMTFEQDAQGSWSVDGANSSIKVDAAALKNYVKGGDGKVTVSIPVNEILKIEGLKTLALIHLHHGTFINKNPTVGATRVNLNAENTGNINTVRRRITAEPLTPEGARLAEIFGDNSGVEDPFYKWIEGQVNKLPNGFNTSKETLAAMAAPALGEGAYDTVEPLVVEDILGDAELHEKFLRNDLHRLAPVDFMAGAAQRASALLGGQAKATFTPQHMIDLRPTLAAMRDRFEGLYERALKGETLSDQEARGALEEDFDAKVLEFPSYRISLEDMKESGKKIPGTETEDLTDKFKKNYASVLKLLIAADQVVAFAQSQASDPNIDHYLRMSLDAFQVASYVDALRVYAGELYGLNHPNDSLSDAERNSAREVFVEDYVRTNGRKIISVGEETGETVLNDLIRWNFFGLDPQNIPILVSPAFEVVVPDPQDPNKVVRMDQNVAQNMGLLKPIRHVYGHGFMVPLFKIPGAAYVWHPKTADKAGYLQRLDASAMDYLQERAGGNDLIYYNTNIDDMMGIVEPIPQAIKLLTLHPELEGIAMLTKNASGQAGGGAVDEVVSGSNRRVRIYEGSEMDGLMGRLAERLNAEFRLKMPQSSNEEIKAAVDQEILRIKAGLMTYLNQMRVIFKGSAFNAKAGDIENLFDNLFQHSAFTKKKDLKGQTAAGTVDRTGGYVEVFFTTVITMLLNVRAAVRMNVVEPNRAYKSPVHAAVAYPDPNDPNNGLVPLMIERLQSASFRNLLSRYVNSEGARLADVDVSGQASTRVYRAFVQYIERLPEFNRGERIEFNDTLINQFAKAYDHVPAVRELDQKTQRRDDRAKVFGRILMDPMRREAPDWLVIRDSKHFIQNIRALTPLEIEEAERLYAGLEQYISAVLASPNPASIQPGVDLKSEPNRELLVRYLRDVRMLYSLPTNIQSDRRVHVFQIQVDGRNLLLALKTGGYIVSADGASRVTVLPTGLTNQYLKPETASVVYQARNVATNTLYDTRHTYASLKLTDGLPVETADIQILELVATEVDEVKAAPSAEPSSNEITRYLRDALRGSYVALPGRAGQQIFSPVQLIKASLLSGETPLKGDTELLLSQLARMTKEEALEAFSYVETRNRNGRWVPVRSRQSGTVMDLIAFLRPERLEVTEAKNWNPFAYNRIKSKLDQVFPGSENGVTVREILSQGTLEVHQTSSPNSALALSKVYVDPQTDEKLRVFSLFHFTYRDYDKRNGKAWTDVENLGPQIIPGALIPGQKIKVFSLDYGREFDSVHSAQDLAVKWAQGIHVRPGHQDFVLPDGSTLTVPNSGSIRSQWNVVLPVQPAAARLAQSGATQADQGPLVSRVVLALDQLAGQQGTVDLNTFKEFVVELVRAKNVKNEDAEFALLADNGLVIGKVRREGAGYRLTLNDQTEPVMTYTEFDAISKRIVSRGEQASDSRAKALMNVTSAIREDMIQMEKYATNLTVPIHVRVPVKKLFGSITSDKQAERAEYQVRLLLAMIEWTVNRSASNSLKEIYFHFPNEELGELPDKASRVQELIRTAAEGSGLKGRVQLVQPKETDFIINWIVGNTNEEIAKSVNISKQQEFNLVIAKDAGEVQRGIARWTGGITVPITVLSDYLSKSPGAQPSDVKKSLRSAVRIENPDVFNYVKSTISGEYESDEITDAFKAIEDGGVLILQNTHLKWFYVPIDQLISAAHTAMAEIASAA